MVTKPSPTIESLAKRHGVATEWKDISGKRQFVPDETVTTVLNALGALPSTEQYKSLQDGEGADSGAEHNIVMSPLYVLRQGKASRTSISFTVACGSDVPLEKLQVHWEIQEESGMFRSGRADISMLLETETRSAEATSQSASRKLQHVSLDLPRDIPIGYHTLTLMLAGPLSNDSQSNDRQTRPLIVAPATCYMPAHITENTRLWGPRVDLSMLSSERNWGIGDFSDLKTIVNWCATKGSGVIALSPIHASYTQAEPIEGFNPFLPSHRGFIDSVYLDVEEIDDFKECEEARLTVSSEDFQKKLESLRELVVTDLAAVRALKNQICEILYSHFRENHLNNSTFKGREFRYYQNYVGESLRKFATFEVLAEQMAEPAPNQDEATAVLRPWTEWPQKFSTPEGEELREFVTANIERIEYFEYLQWQAMLQFKAVGEACLSSRLPLGVCSELSPWVRSDGAETWYHQECFMLSLRQAEPPGPYSPEGRIWNSLPLNPDKFKASEYKPLINALRANMCFSGALRLTNLTQWLRSCCATGPDAGDIESITFIHQHLDEVLSIIALESHRNQCIVFGDSDFLAQLPDNNDLKDQLSKLRILHHHDFLHRLQELDGEEHAKLPSAHMIELAPPDLSPLSSFWQGEDLIIREEHNLFKKKLERDSLIDQRVLHRLQLLRQLEASSLLPDGITTDPASVRDMTPALATAIVKLLSNTGSIVVTFRLSDLGENIFPVTVYGDRHYAHWRYKTTPPLETLLEASGTQSMIRCLQEVRGFFFDAHSDEEQEEETSPAKTRAIIPKATYRLQINKDFDLSKAVGLVDYLKELGVSHVYLSPILQAREGSAHGYDIVDHQKIDSDLGTLENLQDLASALTKHGMGVILDVVPNHMGIGKDNKWWMDVLEHGPASYYSGYFDIDWQPVKKELEGKVLIPVLGAPYGKVLTTGQLKLTFKKETGKFRLNYYEHDFPINPNSYPTILERRLGVLENRLGYSDMDLMNYLSILDALKHLPAGKYLSPEEQERRLREFQVSITRLSQLCRTNPTILEFIEQNLKEFECTPDDHPAVERMHALLEQQAYRLAFWRVASHEINYRRFFDINDLAGVRVEDPRVFEEMHELVLDLFSKGQVHGLRIDHPDGLRDPSGYFLRLQEGAAARMSDDNREQLKLESTKQENLPLYVVVEKILTPFEEMEADWLVHGTTGYDFMTKVNDLLVDERHGKEFFEFYRWCTTQTKSYEQLAYECKRLIMETALSSELNVLSHKLNQISESAWMHRDYTLYALRNALSEVVSYFPVYRTYVRRGIVSDVARQYIAYAIRAAKRNNLNIHPDIFDFIHDVLTLRPLEDKHPDERGEYEEAILNFAMSFQQLTGPVMAKSLEDTLFYKFNNFVALNEVGGEPDHFGININEFHAYNADRPKAFPYSMLATSTHDTKRSEDVRARLNVLSEIPSRWQERVLRWMAFNKGKYIHTGELRIPTVNDEYLIYQTLLGTFPLEMKTREELDAYRVRIERYMIKAAREAKAHTSWINQNQAYEQGMISFIRDLLKPSNLEDGDDPFFQDFREFHNYVARLGLIKSLSQTALKLTCPGVPDFYQGTEVWNFCLVDPDNRGAVEYDDINRNLKEMLPYQSGDKSVEANSEFLSKLESSYKDGRLKLFLSSAALKLRNEFPNLFTKGRYIPVGMTGAGKDEFISFIRSQGDVTALIIAPVRVASLFAPTRSTLFSGTRDDAFWEDTRLSLPKFMQDMKLKDIITGESHQINHNQPRVRRFLKGFPVAILISGGGKP